MESKAKTRFCGMLGFAMRAGKVTIGTELICASLSKSGAKRPRLVIVSSSASEGTKKKICTKCEYYGVDVIETSVDGESLGHLLGKLYAPAAVAIVDDRFAEELKLSSAAMAEDGEV